MNLPFEGGDGPKSFFVKIPRFKFVVLVIVKVKKKEDFDTVSEEDTVIETKILVDQEYYLSKMSSQLMYDGVMKIPVYNGFLRFLIFPSTEVSKMVDFIYMCQI